MKRFLSFTVMVIVLAVLFTACSGTQQPSTTTNISSSTTCPTIPSNPIEPNSTPSVNIEDFREVETSWENINIYRAEVQARLQHENFFTPAEEKLMVELMSSRTGFGTKRVIAHSTSMVEFNELYSSIEEYHFPIIFRENDALVLWYTTDSGLVLLERLYGFWNDSNCVGNLNLGDTNEEIVYSSYRYSMTWDQNTAKFIIWQFNKALETYELPKNSVYCGFSAFEGYIFRHGTDVYSLDVGTQKYTGTVTRIATGVKFVLLADYSYDSDPWSQPLFLMEDGTIKCYISWEGNKEAPADDPSHLVPVIVEGGYQ